MLAGQTLCHRVTRRTQEKYQELGIKTERADEHYNKTDCLSVVPQSIAYYIVRKLSTRQAFKGTWK